MPDLTFRPLEPGDFADVHAYASLWPVVRQLGGWPWPPSEAFTRSRCKPYGKGDGFVWGVVRDGHVIGSVGITGGNLGYTFHPDAHGQGIGTQAARAAISHAFASDPALANLRATTWHDNLPSHRLLLSLGFRQWQTRFEHSRARGLPVLARHYRLARSDWDA